MLTMKMLRAFSVGFYFNRYCEKQRNMFLRKYIGMYLQYVKSKLLKLKDAHKKHNGYMSLAK